MRRTRLVATIGPATSTPERIAQLIAEGMDVARVNFSHGTYADHAASIRMLREAAAAAHRPLAILQDLQGPKIRTGKLIDKQPVELVAGQSFTITTQPIIGDALRVSTTYEMLSNDVDVGDRILLSDGLIELQVKQVADTEVVCEVIHGGRLRESQGINLPEVNISAPALTEKDVEDLHFGLEHDVDYIALSFVRHADDLRHAREYITRAGKETPLIAKIERPEALKALPQILEVADALMVARGDLGVELSPQAVPIIQKQIIEAANRSGVPVITATQMLESMIQNPRPTRAEASDVANAIIDGSDAVMLSGETSIGAYPIEALSMMRQIAELVEASGRRGDMGAMPRWALPEVLSTAWAIGAAASAILQKIPIRAIVVFTQSGTTARIVAHYRPDVPILAFAPSETVYRRLSLLWGVKPFMGQMYDSLDALEEHLGAELIANGLASPGDSVVITGGHPFYRRGMTNFLKVLTL